MRGRGGLKPADIGVQTTEATRVSRSVGGQHVEQKETGHGLLSESVCC